MAYQVLARKYRPQKFADVIGQEHVTRTLQNAIAQARIAHGYIFSGHRGIGKTTIARILAMALNCRKSDRPSAEPCGVCESCTEVREGSSVDVIEIDAATNRGIDEIRELREAARYRPARDRYKIYILDEAHQITDAAFNALLKTLEEPPAHMVFMMATTQPEDIPQTIRSRCQHFSFHAVKFDDIVGQLSAIAKQENIAADPDAIAVLAEAGDGSMRDALSIMDQAIACCDGKLTAAVVLGLVGSVSSEVLESVMGAVAADSSQDALRILDKLVTEGQSPAHFVKQLVRFLRNILVAKVAGSESPLLQISSDERKRVARVAGLFSEEDLARFLQIALRTHDDIGYKQEQRFHLELGVLKMVHAQRLLPLEQLLSEQPLPSPAAGAQRASSAGPAVRSHESSAPIPRSASAPPTVSPFEADRARKVRGPEMSSGAATAVAAEPKPNAIATAVAVAALAAQAEVAREENASADSPTNFAPADSPTVGALREAVLTALENGGHHAVAIMLEEGEWSLAGNELSIKVAKAQVMVEMSFGPEPRRAATQAASQAAGRPIKVSVIAGQVVASQAPQHRGTSRAGGGARARAAEDPIVQYMQEKFGAEIRTVIDQQDK